jgi:DNA polymerase-3 subunit delta
MIILSLQRHFQKLHRLRTAADAGRGIEAVIEDFKPQLHFKQKPLLAAQCRAWRAEALEQALAGIATAARTARVTSTLEDTLAERLVIALARMTRHTG